MLSNILPLAFFLFCGIFYTNATYSNFEYDKSAESTRSIYPSLPAQQSSFHVGRLDFTSVPTSHSPYYTPLNVNTLEKFDEIDNPREHLGGAATTGTGVETTSYDRRTNRFYNPLDVNNNIDSVLPTQNYNRRPAVITTYGVPEHNVFVGEDQNQHVSGVLGQGGLFNPAVTPTYGFEDQANQQAGGAGFGRPIVHTAPVAHLYPNLPIHPDYNVNGEAQNDLNRYDRPHHHHRHHHHHHHQPHQILPTNNGYQYENPHHNGFHGY